MPAVAAAGCQRSVSGESRLAGSLLGNVPKATCEPVYSEKMSSSRWRDALSGGVLTAAASPPENSSLKFLL